MKGLRVGISEIFCSLSNGFLTSFVFSDMEVTRPFTFSYFPEIHIKKKKKGGDKETGKKIQRKISKVKTPSSLS